MTEAEENDLPYVRSSEAAPNAACPPLSTSTPAVAALVETSYEALEHIKHSIDLIQRRITSHSLEHKDAFQVAKTTLALKKVLHPLDVLFLWW